MREGNIMSQQYLILIILIIIIIITFFSVDAQGGSSSILEQELWTIQLGVPYVENTN